MIPLLEILTKTTRSRRFLILLYLPTFLLLSYILLPPTFHASVRLYNKLPFSYEHSVSSYDFKPTTSELRCLAGTLPINSTAKEEEGKDGKEKEIERKEPIPKIIHFIWGLKEGHGSHARFGFLEYLSIKSALISLEPEKIIIHHASLDKTSPYFLKLEKHIQLQYHDPSTDPILLKTKTWQAAHRADLLRLSILQETGGIYLDLDVLSLRPFPFLNGSRDVVMGYEGGNRAGIANAIIISRAASPFIKRWIETYSTFSPLTEWNYHSVTLPLQLLKTHPNEICALSPEAFFWPTWTMEHVEWMHNVLSTEEAGSVKRDVERYGGALVEGQLCYHAWSQMAWGKYLKDLNEEKVRGVDTRFNILMRRFLDD